MGSDVQRADEETRNATTDAGGAVLDARAVREALGRISYPGLKRDLLSFGMVQNVEISGGRVRVQLALRTDDATVRERLQESVSRGLRPIGATSVVVEIVKPPLVLPSHPLAVRAHAPRAGAPDPWAERVRLSRVKHVITVGAGKGGVGKSTVAVNLALALQRRALAVGILDADIYGPSVPTLLGIESAKHDVRMTPEKHIIPVSAHGLSIISFGFFLGEGSPAIWRGPMVSKAVKQFARGVAWPELDVLIVDLPPGTGDIPLSLVQAVEVRGAIVVTQPPRLALMEAQKAGEMFSTLGVPLLGVVENMTGAFGEGGGVAVARSLAAPFLGSIPFDPMVVGEGDSGTPTLLARNDCAFTRAFDGIARTVADALDEGAG